MGISGNEEKYIDIGIGIVQTILHTVSESFYSLGDTKNVDFCNYIISLLGLIHQENELKTARSERILCDY